MTKAIFCHTRTLDLTQYTPYSDANPTVFILIEARALIEAPGALFENC